MLKFWIGIEEQNLRRVKNKIFQFSMPDEYKTNSKGRGSVVRHWLTRPSEEDRKQAILSLEPQLTWLAQTLWNSDDISGAVRVLLLHRYWFKDLHLSQASFLTNIHHALSDKLGKKTYIFQAIDELGASLDKQLEQL